jgi:hypothetical protein
MSIPLNPLLAEARRRDRDPDTKGGGDFDHLPKELRPGPEKLKRAEAISPHKGHPEMIRKDRRAFAHVMANPSSAHSKDVIAAAYAHTIRTHNPKQQTRLKRTLTHFNSNGVRHGKLLEEIESESKKPAVIHNAPSVFDDKDPASSYPQGTEINFGETAPIDMSGIPDLFDPAAVTGDGI